MTSLKRPLPITGLYDKPFWAAVQRRELTLQKCGHCGNIWYPPGPVCPNCLSEDWAFSPLSGRGQLIAWTVFHRQYFADLPIPYLVASIELDEGPLLIGNVLGLSSKTAKLGLRVELYFEEVLADRENWLIPQWRPLNAPAD
jgi:uncharacterized OB-fold protein